MYGALTTTEKDNLVECEDIIQKNLVTYYDVGFSLMRIRENKLYRENYPTFELYCHDKWGFEKNYANKLIRASLVVDNLGTGVPVPTNERTIRALTPLSPDKQREVYQKALETAAEGKVTAKHVEEVVNAMKKKIKRQSAPRQQPKEKPVCMDAVNIAITAIPHEGIRDDDPQNNQNISSNAMDLANAAIGQLEGIRDDDPLLEEALSLVEGWISNKRRRDETSPTPVPTHLVN